MIKLIAVIFLLLSCTAAALAQDEGPNVEHHRGCAGRILVGTQWVQTSERDTQAQAAKNNAVRGYNGVSWNNSSPVWQETSINRADKLTRLGDAALENGNVSEAEADFRDALDQEKTWGTAYAGLARVLAAQGRTEQALAAYRMLFYDLSMRGFDGPEKEKYRQQIYKNPVGAGQYVADGLRYALLLNKTGQWSEAVTVYNSALQGVPGGGDMPKLDLPFDASEPQPVALEAAAHVALALTINFGADPEGNQHAMKEYAAALRLEPDWALTSYYYGYGWQRLSPTERAEFGTVWQAKAALQKAAKTGNAGVKAVAEKASKSAG